MNDYFYEDNKKIDELIQNCIITSTTYSDVFEIVKILSKSFNINSKQEVVRQLLYSKADLDNSVKIIDKRDNKIYGLLIFSEFNINDGSPILLNNNELGKYLSNYTQINGYSFIIDKRLRNTSFDKLMLDYCKDFVNEFDFIWCGVEKKLKSHNYWQRLGFVNILKTNDADFYVYSNNKKMLLDIFILKTISDNVKNNYFV